MFVYLFEQQSMYFDLKLSSNKLQCRIKSSQFEFMTFFEYNRFHAKRRQFLYQSWSTRYVWKIREKWWQIRKKEFAIDRIYYIFFAASEKFFLRLLLIVVSNFTKFENLRIVNEILHFTFKIAWIARKLLNDNDEWIVCFWFAASICTDHVLRLMFVFDMIHEVMTNLATLWKQFKNNFCDDLSRQLQNLQDVFTKKKMSNWLFDYEFYKIDEILSFMNKTLTNYAMSTLVHNWVHSTVNSLIDRELNYNSNMKRKLRNENRAKFNVDQVECFDKIVTIFDNYFEIVHFFLQSSTNIDKIFVYQTFCHHYKAQNDVMLCVTSFEIAVLLLFDDQTSHFRFKISIEITMNIVCNITRSSRLYNFIRRTKLIIWDEISMQHKYCITIVHRTFLNFMQNKHLFDEISIVFKNDFA